MIGETDRTAEQLPHMRNGAQICPLRRGRIAACALKQGQIRTAIFPYRLNEIRKLCDRRHPCRCNDRLSCAGDLADEWQIDILKRSDLVTGNAKIFQKIHGRIIKWRTEAHNAAFFASFKNRRMPFPWRMRLLIEVVECLALPQAILIGDRELPPVYVNRHRICSIGLYLHCIDACIRGGINDSKCTLQ